MKTKETEAAILKVIDNINSNIKEYNLYSNITSDIVSKYPDRQFELRTDHLSCDDQEELIDLINNWYNKKLSFIKNRLLEKRELLFLHLRKLLSE